MSSSGLLTLAFTAVLISGWMFWTERRSDAESPPLNEHESTTGVSGPATAAEPSTPTAAVSVSPSAPGKWPLRDPHETDDETAGQTGTPAPAPSRSADGPLVGGASGAAEVADHQPDDHKATAEPLAAEAPSPPRSAALETLKVDASGQSWVDVEDAGGQRLVYGLLKGGESRRITGRPPFDITIGDATQVMLRHNGNRVDLGPYTHDKVARFTLTATD